MEHESQFLQITVGTPVYTRDDVKLGTVKEVRGECFKVDAPMRPDYWLAADGVAVAAPDQIVTLKIDNPDIADYKISEPAAA